MRTRRRRRHQRRRRRSDSDRKRRKPAQQRSIRRGAAGGMGSGSDSSDRGWTNGREQHQHQQQQQQQPSSQHRIASMHTSAQRYRQRTTAQGKTEGRNAMSARTAHAHESIAAAPSVVPPSAAAVHLRPAVRIRCTSRWCACPRTIADCLQRDRSCSIARPPPPSLSVAAPLFADRTGACFLGATTTFLVLLVSTLADIFRRR